jgi:hypothetical protein
MSYRDLKSVSRPQGCKVLKQVSSRDPQTLGDKPIQDRIGYIMSVQNLCSKEKSFLVLLSTKFLHEPTYRASTKWLARKLSCSRPTLHRVLHRLEGRWIVIRRICGKQSVYGPGPRFSTVLRRSRLK